MGKKEQGERKKDVANMAGTKGKKKTDLNKNNEIVEQPSESPRKRVFHEDKAHKLLACLSCRLLKTEAEFVESGCGNCKYLKMIGDRRRTRDCTTENFHGFMAITKPRESWVAKYNRLNKLVPGFYALHIIGEIPDSVRDAP